MFEARSIFFHALFLTMFLVRLVPGTETLDSLLTALWCLSLVLALVTRRGKTIPVGSASHLPWLRIARIILKSQLWMDL